MKFTLEPKKVFTALLICIALLGLAHIASQLYLNAHSLPQDSSRYLLVTKFGLDVERAFGTWFSQGMLLIASLLLFAICVIKRKQKDHDAAYWGCLGAIFMYLSIDEATSLHELAMDPTQGALGIEQGYLFFAWVIPALIILCFVGLFFVRFWWRLPQRTKILFVVSLGIFLSGAVGMEMIGSNYFSTTMAQDVGHSATWTMLILAEECLEMLGTSLFIYTLLQYIALPGRTITLQLNNRASRT